VWRKTNRTALISLYRIALESLREKQNEEKVFAHNFSFEHPPLKISYEAPLTSKD
jgi:hypothetical protein